jgi:hypothetical protein
MMRSTVAPRAPWTACLILACAAAASPGHAAQLPQFDAIAAQGTGVIVSDPTIRPMQGPNDPASFFAMRPIDFAGNGRPDLFACHGIVPPAPAQKMPCRVLRPQLDGSLLDVTRQLFGNGALPGAVAPRVIVTGDFDEDGRVDVFVAAQGWDAFPFPGEVNVLLLSNADGSYTDASANLPQQPDFTHDAAVGDVNGDGHLDIYVGNISGQQSVGPYFLLGAGDGTFTRVTAGLPATILALLEKFTAAGLVDLDGDASPDLVLGTHGDGGFLDSIVLFNDGSGNFTSRPRLVLPDGPLGEGNQVVQGVGIHDINRDGRQDLILPASQYASFTGLGLQVLINQGGGVLSDETVARLGTAAARTVGSPYPTPRFEDFNEDGLQDFYFSNGPIEDVPRYFLANADGSYEPVAPAALPRGFGFGVSALRFDADARVDLVQVTHFAGGDVLYKTFLNRSVAPPLFADGFEAVAAPAPAD